MGAGDGQGWGRTAFGVAASLSFPRKTGSPGERESREVVKEAFTRAGLEVTEEPFNCTDFAIRVAARWAMVPTGALLVAAAALIHFGFWITGAVTAALSLLPVFYISSRAETGFAGERRRIMHHCANVSGRLPGEPEDGFTLVLMAHYDSKSQLFPIWLRVVLYVATGVSSLALAALATACGIASAAGLSCAFAPYLLPAAAVLFALDLSFLLNTAGNLSEGALDNATGVGVITEIASRLAADPPPGVRLRVIATAAEEIGMCGSVAWLSAHRDEIDPSRCFILNFDGCGGDRTVSVLGGFGLIPRRAPREALVHLFREARKDGIALKSRYIPVGMGTDLMPLLRAGYRGVDFIGLAGRSHTTGDRISLVLESSLGDYVRAGLSLARATAAGRSHPPSS